MLLALLTVLMGCKKETKITGAHFHMPHGLHATMASKQEWERPTQLVAAALHPQIVLKKLPHNNYRPRWKQLWYKINWQSNLDNKKLKC